MLDLNSINNDEEDNSQNISKLVDNKNKKDSIEKNNNEDNYSENISEFLDNKDNIKEYNSENISQLISTNNDEKLMLNLDRLENNESINLNDTNNKTVINDIPIEISENDFTYLNLITINSNDKKFTSENDNKELINRSYEELMSVLITKEIIKSNTLEEINKSRGLVLLKSSIKTRYETDLFNKYQHNFPQPGRNKLFHFMLRDKITKKINLGLCDDLASITFLHIKKNLPNIYVYTVGVPPSKDGYPGHTFVLTSDKEIENINNINENDDVRVIDPWFNTISSYEEYVKNTPFHEYTKDKDKRSMIEYIFRNKLKSELMHVPGSRNINNFFNDNNMNENDLDESINDLYSNSINKEYLNTIGKSYIEKFKKENKNESFNQKELLKEGVFKTKNKKIEISYLLKNKFPKNKIMEKNNEALANHKK